jgi:hypothetical protein
MTLDQVENFVRVSVDGTHDSGVSTVTLESGEASELPLVTDGKYNLVWFDASGFAQPDADPNVEIVRLNSINTNNDTISVTRGVENTSATSKNDSTEYELLLTPTAKTIEDIDANKLDTTQRYTDSEAVSAVDDEVIEPDKSIHSRSIDGTLNLSSDDGLVLAPPVTGTGNISGEGSFVVAGGKDSVDAETLDGIDSSGFLQTTDSVDADTIDGIDSSSFVQTTDSIDANKLDGIDSSGFVKTTDPVDADTLDGINSSGFVKTTDPIDADTLDGINASGFVKTTDPIDADTLDGKDSTTFVETSDSIDADTLNGQTASELAGVISTFVAVGVNEGDINDGRNIDWSNETTNTGSYSFDGRNITIPSNGIYEIRSDIDFQSSGQSRANPNIFIQKNGSTVGVGGRSGYMRDAEGHNHSSIHASFIGSLSSGDNIRVTTSRDADGGTVSPERGHVYIKRIE